MNFKTIISFDYPEALPGEWVLASFRSSIGGEGWSIRLRDNFVEVVGVPEYYWLSARLDLQSQDNELEWRCIGPRHELWWGGVQIAEGISALSMPPDGKLYVGSDPQLEGAQWPYTVSVEVENG